MRVLLTGGSGFIGSAIVRRLCKMRVETAVVDVAEPPTMRRVDEATYYITDVENGETLAGIFQDFRPTHVIHNASNHAMRLAGPREDEAPVALIGRQLLSMASRYGLEKLIFASSAAVYGDVNSSGALESSPLLGKSQYAREKIGYEELLRSDKGSGAIESVVFRYSNVYGDGQDDGVVPIFLRAIKSGTPVGIFGQERAGDRGCVRDFIHVEDVVSANLMALAGGLKGTFNVSSGCAVHVSDVLDRLISFHGAPGPVLHQLPREGEIKFSVLNSNKLRAYGWRPAVSLNEGLANLSYVAGTIPSLLRMDPAKRPTSKSEHRPA